RLARYITRLALAADSIRRHDGWLEITTPTDPRTGSTVRLLDPLDWIHACQGSHPGSRPALREHYGALAHRPRAPQACSRQRTVSAAGAGASADTASELITRPRTSWAPPDQKDFRGSPASLPMWHRDEDCLLHHGSHGQR